MKFTDYKVITASVSLTPDIAPNRNYKIAPKIGCNIKRGGDKIICTFNVELARKDEPIPFEFKVTAVGSFMILPEDDPSTLALKAAEAVYPFVRSTVASLTLLTNIPAYILPMVDMASLVGNSKTVTLTMPSSNELN